MPDEEQFERYLKEFRPLLPDPLPIGRREVSQKKWAPRMWAAGAVALTVVAIAGSWIVHRQGTEGQRSAEAVSADVSVQPGRQPLTMRDANALLETAPSYKAALDDMAFRRPGSRIPKNKQSALAVLAKEKIKL